MSPGVRELTTAEWLLFGVPSLVLGVLPLVAGPRCVAALGLPDDRDSRAALRLIGLRELAVALVFLVRRDRRWLWGFVAQDAVDLPLAGWAWSAGLPCRDRRFRRALCAYAVVAAVDLTAALAHSRPRGGISAAGPARRSRR